MPDTKDIGILYRTSKVNRAAIDEEKRTVELSFSSETPYRRGWGTEILSHKRGAVNLDFLAKGGAPLLVGHWTNDHVGVIEEAKIGADRKGRAVVRFGEADRAKEIFHDVVTGIRQNVSVGYTVEEMVLEKEDENGPTYRATRWTPLEVSLVSIPADSSVGIGRGAAGEPDAPPTRIIREKDDTMTEPIEVKENQPAPAPPAPAVDIDRISADATNREKARASDILAMGDKANLQTLAAAAIADGTSVEDFSRMALDEMVKRGDAKPVAPGASDIGLTPKEVRQFSFVRAIRAAANRDDRAAQQAAAFELEASAATAARIGRDPRGFFVPPEVMHQRDLVVGTDSAGGYLVQTDVLAANFIDLLRDRIVLQQLGATVLNGLQGNLAIPKLAGGVTAAWVAENAAASASDAVIGQLGMTPKTITANTALSRRLLMQASIDVENMVRDDMAKAIAGAVDAAGINGPGTNAPTGILNTTGIGAVECGADGAAPTWADVVALETEVAVDNADIGALGYLTNPKVRGTLKTTEKAANTAQMVWPDMPVESQVVNGYRALTSNSVPSDGTKGAGTNLSAMIFGNFSDVIIGFWSVLDIIVDPFTNSTSGNVRVTALQDADIGIRHAESFAAFTDAVTA